MYRVSKNRGPFLKLVEFLYLSGNLSEILYGIVKFYFVLEKILYIHVFQQEVTS